MVWDDSQHLPLAGAGDGVHAVGGPPVINALIPHEEGLMGDGDEGGGRRGMLLGGRGRGGEGEVSVRAHCRRG